MTATHTVRPWRDRLVVTVCVAVLVTMLGWKIPESLGWIGDDEGTPSEAAPVSQVSFPGPAGPPESVVVPTVGIDAPVVGIEMDAKGVLTPPADVAITGWWIRSAQPGAPAGQTLITGHSLHRGGGVMDRLGEVKPGDPVEIRAGGQSFGYTTTQVQVLSKDELAAQSNDLFGQDLHPRRLVLVTCTDWNGTSFDSNTVVFADPVA